MTIVLLMAPQLFCSNKHTRLEVSSNQTGDFAHLRCKVSHLDRLMLHYKPCSNFPVCSQDTVEVGGHRLWPVLQLRLEDNWVSIVGVQAR